MLYYKNKPYNKSLDSLFISKEATNVEIKKDIQKLLNKGENVYCVINPYTAELSDGENIELMYDTDYDTLMDRYFLMNEEI